MVLRMTSNPRITVTLTDELLQMVDDYWHRQKLTNRNAAFRELLQLTFDWLAEHEPSSKRGPQQ